MAIGSWGTGMRAFSEQDPIRVFLLDDHAVVRRGLADPPRRGTPRQRLGNADTAEHALVRGPAPPGHSRRPPARRPAGRHHGRRVRTAPETEQGLGPGVSGRTRRRPLMRPLRGHGRDPPACRCRRNGRPLSPKAAVPGGEDRQEPRLTAESSRTQSVASRFFTSTTSAIPSTSATSRAIVADGSLPVSSTIPSCTVTATLCRSAGGQQASSVA